MQRSDEARRAILASIRRNLTLSAPHDVVHAERHAPPVPSQRNALPVLGSRQGSAVPAPASPLPVDPIEFFRTRLEAVGGRFVAARGAAEVTAAIAGILGASSARSAAASDAPRVAPLAEAACAAVGVDLQVDPPADALFAMDVGISGAQWGIVETGTLVMESARERHRLVSLVPRVHIALLRADRLCATLGEALARVREGDAGGSVASAAVTLITGPSRTSDIELTLAIGVHGPQELHVILMEPGDSPSDAAAIPADPSTHSEVLP